MTTAVRSRPRAAQGRPRPQPARSRPAPRSRSAARSLPQETAGPRLQVLPRRVISGRTLLRLGAALFFIVLAGSVTIQAQRIEAQHRIDRLDQQLIAAQERQRVLRADVAVAESPERVMQAASELGMVEPGPVLPLLPPANEPAADEPAAAPEVPPTSG